MNTLTDLSTLCTIKNKNKKVRGFKKNAHFPKVSKIKKNWHKFLSFWASINLPWGHLWSHTKFGHYRLSCFYVYWIQTDRHPDKQSVYINVLYRFCPGAKHVNLYVDEDGHLLTPLTRLTCLQELKLLGTKLIQSIGTKTKLLSLYI